MSLAVAFLIWAAAQQPPADPEQKLMRERNYEKAIAAFEERIKSGNCRGAICEADLAIAHSRLHHDDAALLHAQKAAAALDDEPPLAAREANEIGVILFRAPKRSAKQLAAATKAFRFARAHYTGRASNIAYNLMQALLASGARAEAAEIRRQLDSGMLIDPTFGILADFKGVAVEAH